MTISVDIHPFEKAGYGPAPYVQQSQLEDTDCGLVCDSCGKTGLRYKFELLSSTNQLFGVGSECIKKADPGLWLELKSHYGAQNNISPSAVTRREAYDKAYQLYELCVKESSVAVINTLQATYKCSQPFDSVKRCQTKTFNKEAEQLQEMLDEINRREEEKRKRDSVILEKQRLVARLYRQRLSDGTLPLFNDRLRNLAHACAENSSVTDYIRSRRYGLDDLLRYL